MLPIVKSWLVKPVMFPPGRAKLGTRPAPTGSREDNENDWDRLRQAFEREDRQIRYGQNRIRLLLDKLGRQTRKQAEVPLRRKPHLELARFSLRSIQRDLEGFL